MKCRITHAGYFRCFCYRYLAACPFIVGFNKLVLIYRMNTFCHTAPLFYF
nr:MAG TPA: hypothetical protein [Caudoviricetes sp.]